MYRLYFPLMALARYQALLSASTGLAADRKPHLSTMPNYSLERRLSTDTDDSADTDNTYQRDRICTYQGVIRCVFRSA